MGDTEAQEKKLGAGSQLVVGLNPLISFFGIEKKVRREASSHGKPGGEKNSDDQTKILQLFFNEIPSQ